LSIILREGHRLRLSEKTVLRRIFGCKRVEVTGTGENYIMRSSIICTLVNGRIISKFILKNRVGWCGLG
jgi:hypothetical protein